LQQKGEEYEGCWPLAQHSTSSVKEGAMNPKDGSRNRKGGVKTTAKTNGGGVKYLGEIAELKKTGMGKRRRDFMRGNEARDQLGLIR